MSHFIQSLVSLWKQLRETLRNNYCAATSTTGTQLITLMRHEGHAGQPLACVSAWPEAGPKLQGVYGLL